MVFLSALKKGLTCLAMLAFLLASMPGVGLAAASGIESNGTAAMAHDDCPSSASEEKPQDKSNTPCCGGLDCACFAGACGGIAKIIPAHGPGISLPSVERIRFAFVHSDRDSTGPQRLKRPPRA